MNNLAIEQHPIKVIDKEMVRVLEYLLECDENITARAVARHHAEIRHASSITRNESRVALLTEYQYRQQELRNYLRRNSKHSQERVADDMAKKDQKIFELEQQVEILTASHVAMIRVVGELGGMAKWLKFFEHYKKTRDSLLKAIPLTTQSKTIAKLNIS